jgi:hypothetical protein
MTDNPHYVTPEEAKKKVCPSSMGGLLMVHDAVLESEHECHGPDCMAWRWVENTGKIWFWAETSLDPMPNKNWVPIEEFQINGRKAGKFKEKPTHGYCGMVRS